jgi:hypothetical protein
MAKLVKVSGVTSVTISLRGDWCAGLKRRRHNARPNE